MSTQANKELLAHVFEAISDGDFAALEPHPGFWQTRQVVPPMRAIFSDWRITEMQQIAEGDLVFTYGVQQFTHIGVFGGVAPTGKRVTLEAYSVDQVVNGIVVEHNSTTTWPDVLRQLGAPGFEGWPEHSSRILPHTSYDMVHAERNKQTVLQLPQRISEGRVSDTALQDGVANHITEFAAIHQAFPDLEAVTVCQIAEGDLVGARATLHGTHAGPLWGIAPSCKTITWDMFCLCRIADGDVQGYNGAVDWTSALIQLGRFPG